MTGRQRTGAAVALLLAGAGAVAFSAFQSGATEAATAPEQLRATVLGTLPHDPGAFTQGLEARGDLLYEGTGLAGGSYVAIIDLGTGAEQKRADVPAPYFGEGITLTESVLWQLTWHDGVAYARDPDTLEELRTVRYDGEGWGVCYQEAQDRLVMSDGSDQLTFRDPETFEVTGGVPVTAAGAKVPNLNELECVGDDVYANIWQSDTIVRVSPDTGEVTAEIDASGLLSDEEALAADVLNGIAHLPDRGTFLLTGKLWPHLFEVEFIPAGS